MNSFEKLLQQNQQWASEKKQQDSSFFENLSETQSPEFLWIGCSDSRVPAEVVVNAQPGEIFNHRNIANQVIHTDFNCLSVLQYAVNRLKVRHIIVCGHYNCGGIQVAIKNQSPHAVQTNKWLMHIKNTYRLHQRELDNIQGDNNRVNRLAELNVIEQIHSLAHTSIIQKAWREEEIPMLHGWMYDLHDGRIKSLISLSPETKQIDSIFQYEEKTEQKLIDTAILNYMDDSGLNCYPKRFGTN